MTDLVLHLGAHKTATTWLQSRLAAGLPALREHGIDFEPLNKFRTAFTRRLNIYARTREETVRDEALDHMRKLMSRGHPRFIGSDENLLGDCSWILHSGRLYGQAQPRLALLAALLPQAPVRIVLTIRSYAPFFASTYCEALRHRPFEAFDACRDRLRLNDGLWMRIVEAVANTFGPERLRVMRFETLHERLPSLLEAFCGAPLDPGLLPETANRRESLSAAAVEALAQVAASDGAAATVAALPAIERQLPRSADFPGFDPWSPEDRMRLDALYAKHVDGIAQRWPGMLI